MSEPPTPPPQEPAHERDWRFRDTGIPCEWAESYRPGGLHPVHLGDKFNEGRYEAIRKLGNGAYSTVWLAFDSAARISDHRFVVLKISESKHRDRRSLTTRTQTAATARQDPNSKYIVTLLDAFVHEGPNGKHPCLVFEPMGPSVSASLNAPRPGKTIHLRDFQQPRIFPLQKTKGILRDVLHGLSFLHANGIVHGDLQSGNFLFSVRDLSPMPVNSLRQDMKDSQVEVLKRLDGKVDKWAPEYLIVAKPLNEHMLPDEDQVVKIIDMESSFPEASPPSRIVTPVALRAPEIILGTPVSRGIDIWSFGCLVFELLTGVPLIQLAPGFMTDEAVDDDQLIQLWEILSSLPSDLLAKWPRASLYFGPDGERLEARPGYPDDEPGFSGDDDEEFDRDDGMDQADERGDFRPPETHDSLEKMFSDNRPEGVDDEETRVIVSLLRWILQYDTSNRPTAARILEHEWFQG